jgi:flagellum-specific ATP synthase
MSAGASLALYRARLEIQSALRWQGRVKQVVGPLVESQGPFCAVGEVCLIYDAQGRALPGEVVGFRGSTVLSMPLDLPRGVRHGDRIVTWGEHATLCVAEEMLGRVIDGRGQPLDSLHSFRACEYGALDAVGPLPLERVSIREPIGCGIRAVDAFLTCGRGQRIGIFGGSGVGKSTLIGMMARNTAADLTVIGLVGERGREVGEFLENLGEEGRKRSVVVVSTSDQSPLLRIRAALAATTAAEYFSKRGNNVLLVVDSLTRLAMAQREIGLAAGEPPTTKGYTPSCFTLLARLIERAGNFSGGSITAFYTVLMEGDDEQDPLVDATRALLDGHIMLDRKLAVRSHYPPIAVLDSVSRLMPSVCSAPHLQKANELRRLLAAYTASEDLIRIGAYQKGSDPTLDKALLLIPELHRFLMQKPGDAVCFSDAISKMLALPS